MLTISRYPRFICYSMTILALALFTQYTFAEGYTATLYEQGSGQKNVLFQFKVSETKDASDPNLVTTEATYTDPKGNIVVTEKTIFKNDTFQRFEIDHKQLEQKGLIENKDGAYHFTKTSTEGTTTEKETVKGDFVISATFRKFIQTRFNEIKNGKTFEFRFGVWDRQETVGFKVFKEKIEGDGLNQKTTLTMKPSSFIIAALVKPIYFTFNHDGSRLLSMNGRVPPKQKINNKWKDLDAEVVYTYESTSQK